MLSSLFVCFHALSIGDSNELCLSSTCYRIIDEVVIGWTKDNASPCCSVSLWKFCLFDWQQKQQTHTAEKHFWVENWIEKEKTRTKESGERKVKIPFYIFLFMKPFHHIYRQFSFIGLCWKAWRRWKHKLNFSEGLRISTSQLMPKSLSLFVSQRTLENPSISKKRFSHILSGGKC